MILYRFSREPLLLCDMKNKRFFCSKQVSYNAVKFFSVISIWYEVPIKIIMTTSEVCFKANNHNTVWNLTKCYCVTSVDLFRIFPWQGKRLKIHFQCNSICVVKSPLRRKKYNSLSYFQHIILISKLQKKDRLKCHTVTFRDFYLSCSLIWLCGTNSPLKWLSKLQHLYQNVISHLLGFYIHSLLWIVPLDWCVTQ